MKSYARKTAKICQCLLIKEKRKPLIFYCTNVECFYNKTIPVLQDVGEANILRGNEIRKLKQDVAGRDAINTLITAAANPIYCHKVMSNVQLKYRKRYMLRKKDK